MPYFYSYFNAGTGDRTECTLTCNTCEEKKADGSQCSLTSCIGTPFCWIHLLHKHHLRIKPSKIEGAGKGLFAIGSKEQRKAPNDVVFKKDFHIINYGGEPINNATLQQRYPGKNLGPYVIRSGKGNKQQIEDAGCQRGVGSISNHVENGTHKEGPLKGKRVINAFINWNLSTEVFDLIAYRDIHHGEEIFVNYGNTYKKDLTNNKIKHSTRPQRKQ